MSAIVGCCVSSRPKTLPSDDRSMPAQKARPLPVTTMAATSSSALARSKAATSSFAIVTVKAFRLLGTVQPEGEDAVGDLVAQCLVVGHAAPPAKAATRVWT